MIGEKERYHGVALSRLINRSAGAVSISSWNSVSRCAYVLDDRSALFIKYSTNRLSPWPFVFSADQRRELDDMSQVIGPVWLVLVCGPEGVISIDWDTAKSRLMRPDDLDGFSIQASRRPSQKFRVRGAGGQPILVSENQYPDSILETMGRNSSPVLV